MLPYRLEMGTTLKTRRGKNLYEFWGDRITKSLNNELQSFKQPAVINLASNEYFKSVNKKILDAPLITPVFKDESKGDYKVIGFFAKKARGAMTRYLVDNRCATFDSVQSFDRLGYKYSKKFSTEQQPVFLRSVKAAEKFTQAVA